MSKKDLELKEIQEIAISKIKPNDENPRFIEEEDLEKLAQSITEFPEMLRIRPIVVNKDMMILGGNMRFLGCQKAGLKKVPVIIADNLTPEQEKEFIIKDNVSGGRWDYDILNEEWDPDLLGKWGLDMYDSKPIDMDKFFEEEAEEADENKRIKMIFEFTEEDFAKVHDELEKRSGSKESILKELLEIK